jgi:hypothetical protein
LEYQNRSSRFEDADPDLSVFVPSESEICEMLADYKYNGGPKPLEFVRRPNNSSDVDTNHIDPQAALIELSAHPNHEHFSGRNCIAGGGSGAARLSDEWQIVAEVNGCLIMGFSKYTQSGDSLFYGGGPRWTPMATHRWSPFAELLFGGRKVTCEVDNPELENKLLREWNDGSGTLPHYPKRSDWSTEVASNGPSLAAGGGVDVVITRSFAWRLVSIQYIHSWMGVVDNIHLDNGFRITTEAVLRLGTWQMRRRVTRRNETYAKTHLVTAVAICFSGNAKSTTRLRIVEFGPDGACRSVRRCYPACYSMRIFNDRNPHK